MCQRLSLLQHLNSGGPRNRQKRGRCTLELKQEAVRLMESGQGTAAAARSLGVVEQTLSNWVKAHRAGRLKEVSGKAGVTAELSLRVR